MRRRTTQKARLHTLLAQIPTEVEVFDPTILKNHYRVTQQVSDLGWVDLDFGCSTILPGSRQLQKRPTSRRNSLNISQPNPGPRPAESPCISDAIDAC